MGSGVSQELAQTHADKLIGIHLTDVPWQNFFFHGNDHSDLSVAEQRYFAAEKKWMLEEGAYAMIQSTIPQTLAYALNVLRRDWRHGSSRNFARGAIVRAMWKAVSPKTNC